MSSERITLDEMLAELGTPSSSAPDGYETCVEIIERTGVSEYKLRKLLRAAHEKKRLAVKYVIRASITGTNVKVPVYRFRRKGS